MTGSVDRPHPAVRRCAWLLLAGQTLYVAATQFHPGGDANNHRAIFALYAQSEIWTAVHVAQFGGMAILLAGLIALFPALDGVKNTLLGQCGVAASAAALALYGALQAVDGVALKQSVDAWMNAPETEKIARFASAESIRWLEWGMRGFHDFVFGFALLLGAAATMRTPRLPKTIAVLMGASAFVYWAQGWIAATDGFSDAQSSAIVTGWVLSVAWMVWLLIAARRHIPYNAPLEDDRISPNRRL